ncbi:hypothetical protein ONR57_20090 [Hoyosella sp. YIM 151337]|uniref:hypothetical protein n=1 Tax=Hoyosella sp. YIM 151337 TaxID=2992742 RepID=UPI0022365C40|nr:hypothetical protein [Hoyosella sp. YIM 151337]MCW4355609.1 hypothetical protein [Hoyosella sp. YIM 151337]
MIILIAFVVLLVALDVLVLLGRAHDSHLEKSPHGSLQWWDTESPRGTAAHIH